MKRLSSIFFVLCIMTLSTTCFAGPNVFSSNNEQYGIIANYYLHAATQSLIMANMALLTLDDQLIDETLDQYEQHMNRANAMMQNIFFTIQVPSYNQEILEMLNQFRSSLNQK
ncbi:MAG: hypothetical protein N3B18_13380 [Desulfobacterota bacterium]|nr:hypothetical protein [Thermodesulfobacteriota bacterium]